MTPEDDNEALAAEYVLGTLDADERAQAQLQITVDPATRKRPSRSRLFSAR